jgi:hypothetical protein
MGNRKPYARARVAKTKYLAERAGSNNMHRGPGFFVYRSGRSFCPVCDKLLVGHTDRCDACELVGCFFCVLHEVLGKGNRRLWLCIYCVEGED